MAAKISFAFLQSAAMSEATASVFYDVGVVDLAVLASKKAVDWAIEWWHRK